MEFIRSDKKSPSQEGEYFCIFHGKRVIFYFVRIIPSEKYFIKNEYFDNSMLEETEYWTDDINNSWFLKPNKELFWLNEYN